MFSPSLATSCWRRDSTLSPDSNSASPSAATSSLPAASARSATRSAKARKLSSLATKSVSQLISTSTAPLASAASTIAPSAATRPAFLSALASPLLRRCSIAASMSPPVSTSAFLHSIMPAPERSRSSLTWDAVILMILPCPLTWSQLPFWPASFLNPGSSRPAALRPFREIPQQPSPLAPARRRGRPSRPPPWPDLQGYLPVQLRRCRQPWPQFSWRSFSPLSWRSFSPPSWRPSCWPFSWPSSLPLRQLHCRRCRSDCLRRRVRRIRPCLRQPAAPRPCLRESHLRRAERTAGPNESHHRCPESHSRRLPGCGWYRPRPPPECPACGLPQWRCLRDRCQ